MCVYQCWCVGSGLLMFDSNQSAFRIFASVQLEDRDLTTEVRIESILRGHDYDYLQYFQYRVYLYDIYIQQQWKIFYKIFRIKIKLITIYSHLAVTVRILLKFCKDLEDN